MQDEIIQRISRLVDGDLDYEQTMDLLKKIQADDRLKAKIGRYQAISHALKTEQYIEVRPDFSRKIFQEIQHEPTYLLPQRKPEYRPNKTTFAIAASVLMVATVAGIGLSGNSPVTGQQPVVSASALSQQNNVVASAQPPANLQLSSLANPPKAQHRKPLTAQFNAYLQAHNSSFYTHGEVDFRPYAKVASYGQE